MIRSVGGAFFCSTARILLARRENLADLFIHAVSSVVSFLLMATLISFQGPRKAAAQTSGRAFDEKFVGGIKTWSILNHSRGTLCDAN